jgi:L-fuculose-phosphate aldolase
MSRHAVNSAVVDTMLVYARRLVERSFVCNTLGTLAVRVADADHPAGVIYTKRKGLSLEEMTADDVAVTDLDGNLLSGVCGPSLGHQLNRAIFRERADIRAVIHVHPDDVIAYGVAAPLARDLPIVSADAALILQKPVHILAPEVNVEADVSAVPGFIQQTNCFIMPNHGVTALGRDVSEAYHRLCTCVAEVRRLSRATTLGAAFGRCVRTVDGQELAAMYAQGERVIYGGTPPAGW